MIETAIGTPTTQMRERCGQISEAITEKAELDSLLAGNKQKSTLVQAQRNANMQRMAITNSLNTL